MHAPPPSAPLPAITALVLCGGQGRRMGGADKGLQGFRGVPLALNALRRLRRQSLPPAAFMLSANRHLDAYAALGAPFQAAVWPDEALPGFAGPLAGFMSGLLHARTPLLLTVPCDVPCFPLSLCERLAHALLGQDAEIATAATLGEDGQDGGLHPQPVFSLMRRELRGSLAAFLQGGQRQARAWMGRHRQVLVPFASPPGPPHAFANANTREELHALEAAAGQAPPSS